MLLYRMEFIGFSTLSRHSLLVLFKIELKSSFILYVRICTKKNKNVVRYFSLYEFFGIFRWFLYECFFLVRCTLLNC